MFNKKFIKIASYIFPILLGFFLIAYSFLNLTNKDIESIKNAFETANYNWVILSVFLAILSHISRAYRWNFLLEPLGYKVRFINSLFSVFTAYFLNIFIPRSGEIARATAVQKYEKIPFEKAFGTIVAERIFDVLMLGIITLIALYLQTDFIEKYLLENKTSHSGVKWIALITGAILLFLAYRYFKNSNHPIISKIIRFIKGLIDGVKSVFTMQKRGAFLLHTFFIWAMYLLMFYVTLFALPETSKAPVAAIVIAFVMGSFSMAVTNGGLGTYPIFVAGALTLYHIPNNIALAFGWIMWTSQTIAILVFGAISMIFLPIYNKNNST